MDGGDISHEGEALGDPVLSEPNEILDGVGDGDPLIAGLEGGDGAVRTKGVNRWSTPFEDEGGVGGKTGLGTAMVGEDPAELDMEDNRPRWLCMADH